MIKKKAFCLISMESRSIPVPCIKCLKTNGIKYVKVLNLRPVRLAYIYPCYVLQITRVKINLNLMMLVFYAYLQFLADHIFFI